MGKPMDHARIRSPWDHDTFCLATGKFGTKAPEKQPPAALVFSPTTRPQEERLWPVHLCQRPKLRFSARDCFSTYPNPCHLSHLIASEFLILRLTKAVPGAA